MCIRDSPVTVTAEVAVNKAVNGSPKFSEVCDTGKARRIVPTPISIRNMATSITGEENVLEVKLRSSTMKEFLAISASRGFLAVTFPGRSLGILVFMNFLWMLHGIVYISDTEYYGFRSA